MPRSLPCVWETPLHYLSALHYATAVTFGSELLLLVAISHTVSIPVPAKAVSLRAGIGTLMVMMTQKIVEEKCIEIKIVLKCRKNDNEL